MNTLDAALEYLRANRPNRNTMRNRFVYTDGGVIWDATEASIADWLGEREADISVEPAEDGSPDEGMDIVTLKGVKIGLIEEF